MTTPLGLLLQAIEADPFDLLLHAVLADAYEERGGPDDAFRALAHRHVARGEWGIVYDDRSNAFSSSYEWDLFLPPMSCEDWDDLTVWAAYDLGERNLVYRRQVKVPFMNHPYDHKIKRYEGWSWFSVHTLPQVWTLMTTCAKALHEPKSKRSTP